jgi:hypothetical protein
MLKNNPILKNPLMRLGYETEDILGKGEFTFNGKTST